MLFFTFIQPHIDYGLLIWGDATTNNLNPMESNLKKNNKKNVFQENRH